MRKNDNWIATFARQSRQAQGLPEHVEDLSALSAVVGLVGDVAFDDLESMPIAPLHPDPFGQDTNGRSDRLPIGLHYE